MTETTAQNHPQNPPTSAGGAQARRPATLANPTHHPRELRKPFFCVRSRSQEEEVG
jgi:hypothetical protein